MTPAPIDEAAEAAEAVMARYEQDTGARVVRTADDLDSYANDRSGPEVIRSGTIGPIGVAAWTAPRREGDALIFYANHERKNAADFLRVRLDLTTGAHTSELIDEGWFETAFDFSAAPELLGKKP